MSPCWTPGDSEVLWPMGSLETLVSHQLGLIHKCLLGLVFTVMTFLAAVAHNPSAHLPQYLAPLLAPRSQHSVTPQERSLPAHPGLPQQQAPSIVSLLICVSLLLEPGQRCGARPENSLEMWGLF